MNMFAKFDEIPEMTLQDIKETKRYGWTHRHTDGQRENSIPTTKFAGGIIKKIHKRSTTLESGIEEKTIENTSWKISTKVLDWIQLQPLHQQSDSIQT